MNSEPNSGRTIELANLRREMDHVQQQRISHLEAKLDGLDTWVRNELSGLDERMETKLSRIEAVLIDRAAQKAVRQAFSHMGVDVDSPSDLQRFRDDLRFGGVFRTAASRSFLAMVAALFGGIGFSIWIVFKDKVGIK